MKQKVFFNRFNGLLKRGSNLNNSKENNNKKLPHKMRQFSNPGGGYFGGYNY